LASIYNKLADTVTQRHSLCIVSALTCHNTSHQTSHCIGTDKFNRTQHSFNYKTNINKNVPTTRYLSWFTQ